MPELRECIAHYLLLLWFFNLCVEKGLDLGLLGFWYDPVTKGASTAAKQKKTVLQLQPNSNEKRGHHGSQSPLWPPMWKPSSKNPQPPPITSLKLRAVSYTPRAIRMDFGALHFQLAYLTHTSIQIYKREIWEQQVKATPCVSRGYRIGLAFEFKDHVAFVTLDLLFQPSWAYTMDTLPTAPCDVYASFSAFLKNVADWIAQRRKTVTRGNLACDSIREASLVWGGVGVYTVCEIFFDAGISPFLTEREVFDCPSRTARLCEALWCFAYESHTNLKSLLKPSLVDGLLAPSVKQRLAYGKWLHVYAQNRCHLTPRMWTLWKSYTATLELVENLSAITARSALNLCDVFEPNLIQNGLKDNIHKDKECSLGHLIFGSEKWRVLQPSYTPSSTSDPLTTLFSNLGVLESETYLNLSAYSTLFINDSRVHWVETTLARRQNVKSGCQIWSATPTFPINLVTSTLDNDDKYPSLGTLTGSDRTSKLFSTIVESSGNSVAIGPLEYCGNGTVAFTTHQEKRVSAVRKPRRDILTEAVSGRSSPNDSDSGDSDVEPLPDDVDTPENDLPIKRLHDEDLPELFGNNLAEASSRPGTVPPTPLPSSPASSQHSSPFSDFTSLPHISAVMSEKARPLKRIKRQHRPHVSADLEIAASSSQLSEAEVSQSSKSGRPQREGSSDKFYGRQKRKYTKRS